MHEPVKSIVQEGINGAQLYSLGHTQRRMVRAVKSAAGFFLLRPSAGILLGRSQYFEGFSGSTVKYWSA